MEEEEKNYKSTLQTVFLYIKIDTFYTYNIYIRSGTGFERGYRHAVIDPENRG